MRKKFLKCSMILLAILLTKSVNAQGLTIIEQDYQRARAESIRQKKLLIIDFYTDWCVPCKQLDAAVFRDSIVSRELSNHFVVLRYNAEKRDSSYKLALKYHIGMYPSTVVLNLKQRVIHRAYGMVTRGKGIASDYLDFLTEARGNDQAGRIIKGVSAPDERVYPKFYEDYLFRVDTKSVDEKLAKYWDSATDYTSEVPFAILAYFVGGNEKVNTYFLNNKAKYRALYGELDVKFIVDMMVGQRVNKAMRAVDRSAFNSAMIFARQNLPSQDTVSYFPAMEERMLQLENKWAVAMEKFSRRKLEQKLDDNASLRFLSPAIEKCNDSTVLHTGSQWMKEIAGRNPSHDNLSAYARLLYKTGNKAQAIEKMKKAVAIGKQAKEDTEESEEWLNKYGGA